MDLGDVQAAEEPSPPPPLRAIRSRPSSWSSSASSGSIEYTSLRDVLSEAGAGGSGSSFGDVQDIDTANINIRNQLLKHAASAYLQSSIVVTPRDRGCLRRFWRRLLQRRLRPRPSCGCAEALADSARRLIACMPL